MNFILDDDSLDKICDIFEHIEKKIEIDLSDFTYESKGKEYLKTTVSNEVCFKMIQFQIKIQNLIVEYY